ncbi:YhjD/YihY/BrkB family envelope integrity protein [Dermatophilaceae bacterium Sec6.4]
MNDASVATDPRSDNEPDKPSAGGLTATLDGFQRRHPQAGFPLAVLYKYFDDSGGYLAALIAYYGFLSLFPLLLLLSTILGFLLAGDPHLQQQILHSALSQFPVIGNQLNDPKRVGGGATGLIIGILGSLYGGLGVAQAVQYAMNTAWMVPKNSRPNPFKARGRSVLLLGTAGLAIVGTTALSTLGASNVGSFGPLLKIVVLVASVLVNAAVFVLAFRIATARNLSVRDVAPGALAAAIVWQLLQTFGVVYVGHVVKGASATNGVFALVLGLIAFLYLTGVAVVLCVEINVVRVDRLHPRSLLTPFTDDVVLTGGDRRAYTGQATAQRNKGFEDIDVEFHPPGQ